MSEKIPTVVSSGKLRVGALEVTVHNLSNGQRVIAAAGMNTLLRFLGFDGDIDPEGISWTEDEA